MLEAVASELAFFVKKFREVVLHFFMALEVELEAVDVMDELFFKGSVN